MLRDGVNELWNADGVPFEQTALPLRQRIMGWLVGRDGAADLEEFLVWLDRPARARCRRARSADGRSSTTRSPTSPELPPELLVP